MNQSEKPGKQVLAINVTRQSGCEARDTLRRTTAGCNRIGNSKFDEFSRRKINYRTRSVSQRTARHPRLEHVLLKANDHLGELINVRSYEFMPCYLWYDGLLYDEFGEIICRLPGDTIYLCETSTTPDNDLLHELGHVVARRLDLISHRENGFRGHWELDQGRLIGEVRKQRHWSTYLNLFSRQQKDFDKNAASELWAELFMLWHLFPHTPESRLLDTTMSKISSHSLCVAIQSFVQELQS